MDNLNAYGDRLRRHKGHTENQVHSGDKFSGFGAKQGQFGAKQGQISLVIKPCMDITPTHIFNEVWQKSNKKLPSLVSRQHL